MLLVHLSIIYHLGEDACPHPHTMALAHAELPPGMEEPETAPSME